MLELQICEDRFGVGRGGAWRVLPCYSSAASTALSVTLGSDAATSPVVREALSFRECVVVGNKLDTKSDRLAGVIANQPGVLVRVMICSWPGAASESLIAPTPPFPFPFPCFFSYS